MSVQGVYKFFSFSWQTHRNTDPSFPVKSPQKKKKTNRSFQSVADIVPLQVKQLFCLNNNYWSSQAIQKISFYALASHKEDYSTWSQSQYAHCSYHAGKETPKIQKNLNVDYLENGFVAFPVSRLIFKTRRSRHPLYTVDHCIQDNFTVNTLKTPFQGSCLVTVIYRVTNIDKYIF